MTLTCPNCATTYQLESGQLPPSGRTVRCAKCRFTWHQAGETRPAPLSVAPLIITCPTCTTQFLINCEKALLSGRAVRCGRCRHIWRYSTLPPLTKLDASELGQGISDYDASCPAQLAIEKNATEEPNAHHTRPALSDHPTLPGRKRAYRVRFVALAVLLMVISGVLISQFRTISPKLPAAGNAPSSVTAREAITLRNVSFGRHTSLEMGMVITIHGTILNSTKLELPVPNAILITLKDVANVTLHQTAIKAPVRRLKGGQSVTFETDIFDTPELTSKIDVRLAASGV